MTDIEKMIITLVTTILAGVVIFIGGQLLLKFIIEPLQYLRKKLSEIQHALIFHAPAIHTPVGDRPSEKVASKALRSLACDLRVSIEVIPYYSFWKKFWKDMPDRKAGLQAATHLIGLSNSVYQEDRTKNYNKAKKIRSLLNLEEDE